MACRSSDVIELSDEERAELEAMSGRSTAPFRTVQRARIVLYSAHGVMDATGSSGQGRGVRAPERAWRPDLQVARGLTFTGW